MRNIVLYFFFILFLFTACSSKPQEEQLSVPEVNFDSAFSVFSDEFIEDLWKLYPDWASSQGYHKYDSVLIIPDEAFRKREIAFCEEKLNLLKRFDALTLSTSNRTDFYMLENLLKRNIFNINEFREYEWNPAYYNVSSVFADIVQNKNTTNEKKLQALYLRMRNVPAYYENARKMIKNPTIEHTNLAIKQNIGGKEVFTGMMMDSLRKANLSHEEKSLIITRINECVKSIDNYVAWLKKIASGISVGERVRSFRIGKELYEKKFMYDIQSRFTVEEVYKKALARKEELHKKMLDITKQIFNKYFPNVRIAHGFTKEHIRMLIDEISKKHVKKEDFQNEIERQIPVLTKFVNDRNLIYLDPNKPLVVRKEPEYMAGVAGASISSPGPYDKEGNTYYNVGSLAGYSPEQAESYLREYNHYILQILNIHEAIPGHYVQLVYSNQSPSLVKSLFGNGAMIEGWAVYAELLMLENGYGNHEPEMWLMYYKWHLRSVCNTILDYSVHVLGMSREEALKLLMEDAFQQKQEAENKWNRVSLTQVQLTSYFTGFTEIYELREEMKKKQGDKFNVKAFNEKLLSYGSAPVKYIRELMLNSFF